MNSNLVFLKIYVQQILDVIFSLEYVDCCVWFDKFAAGTKLLEYGLFVAMLHCSFCLFSQSDSNWPQCQCTKPFCYTLVLFLFNQNNAVIFNPFPSTAPCF